MTTSKQFCCVCLNNRTNLKLLSSIETNDVSYYVKLTCSIPEMCVKEITEDRFTCDECCSNIDVVYNFRKTCLENLPMLIDYVNRNIESDEDSKMGFEYNKDVDLSEESDVMDDYSNEAIDIVKVELQEGVDEKYIPGDCDNFDIDENEDVKRDMELNDNQRSITPELEIMEQHNIQLAIDVAKKRSPKRTKADGYSGPFKCDLCTKECSYWSQLVIHRRTHTGEKPFQCPICKKFFSKSHSLIRHTRTHTGEKPHECNICHRRFLASSNLQSHMKTHFEDKPYECNICKKSFKTQSCLLGHKKRHSDERPHECPVCKMRFKDTGSLTRHKRTHTLENYHRCNICSKGFRDRSGLTRHLKNHEQPVSNLPTNTPT